MSVPYLGEIKAFPFAFAPKGWALCSGQLLPINQNQALFSLLSTNYGGDGQTNFGLPDLRGRTPIHIGADPATPQATYTIGHNGGLEQVTLTLSTLPAHAHSMNAVSAAGNVGTPTNTLPASVGAAPSVKASVSIYAPPPSGGPEVALAADTVGYFNGGGAHNNLQPSLVLNFCIALVGVYPSRN